MLKGRKAMMALRFFCVCLLMAHDGMDYEKFVQNVII